MTGKRAGIYARISEDREETQAGVGRQLEDCERERGRREWSPVDQYVDNDISAWKKGVVRPEYERMLQDIRDGRINAVIVYNQDRLWRQPREIEDFITLCESMGTALASITGDYDLSTSEGRLMARINGAVAAKESDDKSRRIRRKHQSLADEGKVSGGGTRPFGFEADRVTIRESEAEILRDMAGRLLAGETLRGLTVDLNARGVTTTTDGAWHPNVVRRLLRSARISGQREHKGEIVADAVWPAIVTPAQTQAIRALLDDPVRRATRPARKYLLTGVLRCEACGAALVARPREDGRRRYVCAKGPGLAGRGCTYVLAEPVEEFVIEAVMIALDSPEFAERLSGHRAELEDTAGGEAEALASRLDELATAYARQDISMREWIVARKPIQEQLDDAKRRQSRAVSSNVLAQHLGHADELRERWPDLSFDRRHAIVRAVVSEVLVRPGRRGYNRFQPDRFDLIWRY